ncbi:hypothetical protein JXB12_11100 [candidate division KSB1 bacterium]|nr:hypothetical protein [candidate division KSB1 bacterium]
MSHIKFIILIVILLVCTEMYAADNEHDTISPDSLQQSEQVANAVRSPRRAMVYSLMFPGLGQLYNRDYFKSVLFFGTEFGLLANSIYLNQKRQESADAAEREFYINNRNLSTWWLIGVAIYSAMDAYVDAHMADFDESPNLNLQMFYDDEYSKLYLSLTYNF